MNRPPRKLLIRVLEKIALIVLGCILAELALRIFQYKPWRQLVHEELGSVVTEADLSLGWSLRPGFYTFRNGSSVTIWDGKERASGKKPSASLRSVALLGDSNVFGYAISDHETAAWALQQSRPDLRIRNFAAPGYSLLQETLLAERLVGDTAAKPDFLAVALADFDGYRSVAHPQWAELITERSPFLDALIPYAELSRGGALVVRPAGLFWPELPLRRHSAVVKLLEQAYEYTRARRRIEQGPEIVRLLISRLQAALDEVNVPWVLFSFSPGGLDRFGCGSFLRQEHVPFVECVHPHFNEPGFTAKDDGHPNGEVHRYWAECLGQYLGRHLDDRASPETAAR